MFKNFKLEEYLAKYEFSAPYLMCSSDPQTMLMKDLLALASTQEMDMWDTLPLSYTTPEGHPLLRETIATQMYPGLDKDQSLCFAGVWSCGTKRSSYSHHTLLPIIVRASQSKGLFNYNH